MYDPTLAQQIGAYILERRKELGMTQKDLKKTLGFSAQFLGRIEKGKVMIPERCLVRLINLLELDFSRMDKIYRSSAAERVNTLFEEARKKKVRRGA
ncbi:MAG TPA: helix-turn-helix domain-containing protein [Bdellovibrionales bacterium]|nr:helix-turn-helix domain-containing protein [Bdellovibrionales bacterium]